jgi:dTDP-4-dehydrorhamnose 3,5-epimerase
MIFQETPLKGAFVIDLQRLDDSRGFFARAFCQHEFDAHGLEPMIAQCNVSFNSRKGTLRGMHYQVEPFQEVKLVRCSAGAIYDVIVDLRPDSATYKLWFGVELAAQSGRMIYVPKGFAHGYLTLVDESEVFYQASEFYSKEYERGARWNDSAFGIAWPFRPVVISEKDRNHPDFNA